MAIIADQMYNLRDAAAQFGPDGQELAVAEVLSQTNDIIGDMLIRESNLDSGHEYAVRTGIPAGTWRRAYQGVDAEKATQKGFWPAPARWVLTAWWINLLRKKADMWTRSAPDKVKALLRA